MSSLQDATVVITGAASGIGRALALEAASRGAHLALSDVDHPGLQLTADLVADRYDVRVRLDKLDVRDPEAWKEYAEAVVDDLGPVRMVLNNAGIALIADVEVMPLEALTAIMDVDFWGVVHGTRAFLPHLIAHGGHVVNISSIFGIMAVPGQSAYNAAKFAVRGFTEALRQEMLIAGHPVQVTCVHPGGVRTEIVRNATAVGADLDATARLFDKMAMTSPERAARIILDAALAGKARVLVGADAKALDLMVRLTGSAYQRIVSARAARMLRR